MCGRFVLTADPRRLSTTFAVAEVPAAYRPRYNTAPSQLIAVVGLKPDGKTRGLALLTWGLVPRWAKSPNEGPRPINAMAETVDLKAPFRDPFRDRRCLVPADGFFEWATEDGKKVPHLFRLKSGEPFAFAGVWDVWQGQGYPRLLTCALITVPANEVVQPVHARMPAVLEPGDWDRWLDPESDVPDLRSLLKPYPADEMEAVRVGPAVNKIGNDGPECVVRAG